VITELLTCAKRAEPEHQLANVAPERSDETTMHDAEDRTNNTQNVLHDEGNSTQLMEQQAESVRYLNELNTVSDNYSIDLVVRLTQ